MSLKKLQPRNLTIDGRRTSMRQEPAIWDALTDIAQREGITVAEFVGLVKRRLERQRQRNGLTGVTLAAAVRVCVTSYYRMASTEDGHANAGHGNGSNGLFVGTPLDDSSEEN